MLLNKLRRLLRTLTFLCITCLVLTFIIQVTEKVKTIYQGRTAKFESQFLLTTKYSAKLTSFEEQNFLEIAKRNWLNDKYLIVSLVNFAHWELALNLMLSLKKCGIEKFLAICLDSDVFAKLNETKTAVDHIAMVPSNWLSQKLNKNEGMWDSQHYVSITHAKTEVVAKLLSLGFTVFFNDVDIVWISSEVLSYIEANASKKAEIIFTWDGAHMNTGI